MKKTPSPPSFMANPAGNSSIQLGAAEEYFTVQHKGPVRRRRHQDPCDTQKETRRGCARALRTARGQQGLAPVSLPSCGVGWGGVAGQAYGCRLSSGVGWEASLRLSAVQCGVG